MDFNLEEPKLTVLDSFSTVVDPSKDHRICILGPSESGKTMKLFQLWEDVYIPSKENFIYVVYSNNFHTIKMYERFFEFHKLEGNLITIEADDGDEKLRRFLDSTKKTKGEFRFFLCLDDFVGSTTGKSLEKKKSLLNFIVYQGRHNGITSCFVTQTIISLDARLLGSCTIIILTQDDSRTNLTDHTYSKILSRADGEMEKLGLIKNIRSKACCISTYYRLLARDLEGFQSLILTKDNRRKTKIHIIDNNKDSYIDGDS